MIISNQIFWFYYSFNTKKTIQCKKEQANLIKQWAALIIHWLLIIFPAQNGLPKRTRTAIHGNAPNGDACPDTILGLFSLRPQSCGEILIRFAPSTIFLLVPTSSWDDSTTASSELSFSLAVVSFKLIQVLLTLSVKSIPSVLFHTYSVFTCFTSFVSLASSKHSMNSVVTFFSPRLISCFYLS